MNVLVNFYIMFTATLFLTVRDGVARRHGRTKPGATQVRQSGVDFLSKRVLDDGEVETRVSHRGVVAMETIAPGAGQYGLRLREITNGKVLLQSVYNVNGELSDCDISSDKDDVNALLRKFSGVENAAHKLSPQLVAIKYYKHHLHSAGVNMTLYDAKKSDLRHHQMTDLKEQKHQCRHLHALLRQHRRDKIKMTHGERHRAKRAMLIYPGTNWCGAGSVAKAYDDLGLNINTDKCCREHDHCPYTISSFQSEYNVFNYRFHTISHCGCDRSFKACLKAAGNDVAHMVGHIYFNVVKMRCFNLKSEKMCVKRSWWGKCLRYEKSLTAYMDDTTAF